MSLFSEVFPHGEVTLIDSMGDDLRIVNAARVSFSKHREEFDEVQDSRILAYMAKHGHWTPFAHVMVTIRFTMPLFVIREWYRHEVGFIRNEESRRYVDSPPVCHMPSTMRLRHENKKQGSADTCMSTPDYAKMAIDEAVKAYNDMIHEGIAPEQARIVLPQGMYTSFYETASLAAYARLCGLRIQPDAQKEIRLYALEVSKLLYDVAPRAWAILRGANQ